MKLARVQLARWASSTSRMLVKHLSFKPVQLYRLQWRSLFSIYQARVKLTSSINRARWMSAWWMIVEMAWWILAISDISKMLDTGICKHLSSSSTSACPVLDKLARRAGLMSFLSRCLNDVILQIFMTLARQTLVECLSSQRTSTWQADSFSHLIV